MPDKTDPAALTQGFAADLGEAFGPDLQALIVVGSAARGDFLPGISDLNTLAVLSPEGMARLEHAYPVLNRWQKKRVAAPHFMTQESICRSLDSYPLEILDFITFHRLVAGRDPLAGLVIPPEAMRLQVEREARGKLFLLRQAFAAHAGRDRELREVLKASLSAFAAIFQGLLWLHGQEIPADRKALIERAAAIAGFSPGPYLAIHALRAGKSGQNLPALFKNLLTETEKLVRWADTYMHPGETS